MATASKAYSNEEMINRWSFDFYVFRALDAFRNGDYEGFSQFEEVIKGEWGGVGPGGCVYPQLSTRG